MRGLSPNTCSHRSIELLAITNPGETYQAGQEDTTGPGPDLTASGQDIAVGRRRFIIPSRPAEEQQPLSSSYRNGDTTESPSTLEPARVLRVPRAQVARQHFILLQRWEGTVTNVNVEEFSAVLRDLSQAARPEEQASFLLDEVPDPDRSLLVPGAVFYWTIGYEVTLTGTRKTVSMLRFRRLPAWSESDLRRIKADAERFHKLLAPNS
jgi:hypothetical protein